LLELFIDYGVLLHQEELSRKLGLDAHVMAGEELQFEDEFDDVFSNAVLHWIKRADPTITGVYRSR
jgi:hypothetical protein